MSKGFRAFPTVHCHPSSLDSASTPEAFAKREAELGSGVLTCTDHGTLQAAFEVVKLAKKHKLTPVVGLEGYFRDDNCPILQKLGVPRTDTIPRGSNREAWLARYPQGTFFDYLKYYHITLHFMDNEAYLCAVRLLSKADDRAEQHGSERKPLFDWNDLEELASYNVTATTSCLVGMVQRHLMKHSNGPAAIAYLDRLHHLFGSRFYVEVFPHACTHDFVKTVMMEVETATGKETRRYPFTKQVETEAGAIHVDDLAEKFDPEKHGHVLKIMNNRRWETVDPPERIISVKKFEGFMENECRPWAPDGDVQRGCNRFVMIQAKKRGIPIVIGDDSHFVTPEKKRVQDLRLAQSGPWRMHGSYHRQTSEEAFKYFHERMDISEDVFNSWVDNTLGWAEQFKAFKLDTTPSLPTKFFPKDSLARTRELLLHHGRIIKDPVYMQRLKTEIEILHSNGKIDLLPYFQTIEEVCRLYNDEGIVTGTGRGSAAGLYFTYALGITHTDPMPFNLSAERFITPARILQGGLPDIDQDLPNRDLLEGGYVTDVVDFEASDGTTHSVPASFKVETAEGWLRIGEVTERGLEFKQWWQPEETPVHACEDHAGH